MNSATAPATLQPATGTLLTRTQAEDFLYLEARLIDEWKLEQWANLFTDDGEYLIPPIDEPDGVAGVTLFLVYDDRFRLGERAKRLLKKTAHAEFPHSVVRHMISNVEIEAGEQGMTRIRCNFVAYRSRKGGSEVFPGHSVYDVVTDGSGKREGVRIQRKFTVIDVDSLRIQRRMSIIL